MTPLASTFATDRSFTAWAGREVIFADLANPVGVFEAYICRQCGFTELYARDAEKIPIGPEFGTVAFDVGGAGPYR